MSETPPAAPPPAPTRPSTALPVDLIVAAGLGLLAIVAVLLRADPLRLALGWLLPLLLPGYAFIAWLFPARRDNIACARCLGGVERVALGSVASVALTILVGVTVNFLPSGITLATMAYGLGILTLAFLVLAADARMRLVPGDRPRFWLRAPVVAASPRTGLGMGLLLAVSFAGLLLAVVFLFPFHVSDDAYTSVYLLGGGGNPACLPDQYANGTFLVHPANPGVACEASTENVTVGIVNHEGRTTLYQVRVFWSQPTGTDIASSVPTAPATVLNAQLGPMAPPGSRSGFEQEYERSIHLAPPPESGLQRLNVQVFKDTGKGFPAVPDQYLYFYVQAA